MKPYNPRPHSKGGELFALIRNRGPISTARLGALTGIKPRQVMCYLTHAIAIGAVHTRRDESGVMVFEACGDFEPAEPPSGGAVSVRRPDVPCSVWAYAQRVGA